MALSLLQADMASTIQQQQRGDRWAHPESEFKLKQQSVWPLQEKERNACAKSEIVHPTPRALSLAALVNLSKLQHHRLLPVIWV